MLSGDEALLAEVPDFISLGGLMKATPSANGRDRFLYIEASNEDLDHQNEIVLQKALSESAPYYKRHGNIDISHYSLIGLSRGIPNYMEYEIGKPREVGCQGNKTFVKAELYQGESAQARNANMVWDSLTKQRPAMSWYPSVGGAVLAKSVRIDPSTNNRVAVIERVRWNNLALDRTPVNTTVPEVSLLPIGTFTKSLGGFVLNKALTAGYGTDAAALAGGSSLRKQSLDRRLANYWDFRNKLASDIRDGKVTTNQGTEGIADYCVKAFKLSQDEASEWTERFLTDLNNGRKRRAS
jgi:hypothetical protein